MSSSNDHPLSSLYDELYEIENELNEALAQVHEQFGVMVHTALYDARKYNRVAEFARKYAVEVSSIEVVDGRAQLNVNLIRPQTPKSQRNRL